MSPGREVVYEHRTRLTVADAVHTRARALARELDLPDDASRSELISALASSRLIVASLPERVDDTDDLLDALRRLPPQGLGAGPSAGWLPVQPSIPSRQPRYEIHIKAVLCADSDGSNAAAISEGVLAPLFQGLSQVYFRAGLTFVHSTIVLHDTMINQDFTLPDGVDLSLPAPPISKDQKDASFEEHNKVRSDWARENHRGSLVVLFRYGTSVKWNEKAQHWVVGSATFAFSGSEHEFVAMNQGTELLLLAHESGHYFHLNHTQGDAVTLTDAEQAKYPKPETVPADREGGGQLLRAKLAEAIRVYVDAQGNPPDLGLNVLDADGLADTAPDPGPQIFLYEYGDACATQSINVDVKLTSGTRSYTVDPNRQIIMSYFFRCPGGKSYSEQEIDIIRRSLETETFPTGVLSRHHLIAIKKPKLPILVQIIHWLVERISSIISGIVESLVRLIRPRR